MKKLCALLLTLALAVLPAPAPAFWHSIEQVGVVTGGGGPLLLDTLSASPQAAYSTRKLRSAYAGAALRVIRTSDSAQSDIGFASSQLDTSALAAFCDPFLCLVNIWYDQSGHGLDASSATTGIQIRDSGALTSPINGFATLGFGIASPTDYMTVSTASAQPTTYVVAFQFRAAPSSGAAALITGGNSSTVVNMFGTYNAPPLTWMLYDGVSGFLVTGTPDTNVHLAVAILNTGSSSVLVDNVSVISGALVTASSTNIFIGAGYVGFVEYQCNANIGEVLIFNSVLSGGDQTLIHTDYDSHWGTP